MKFKNWEKFISNNYFFDYKHPDFRRVYLNNVILLSLIILLIFLIIINIAIFHLYAAAWMETISLPIIGGILYYFRKTNNIKITALATAITMFALLIGYLHIMRNNAYAFYWIVFIPMIAYFLLGKKMGQLLTILFYAYVFLFVFLNYKEWEPAKFGADSFVNMIIVTINVVILVSYFEYSRNEAHQRMTEANQSLEIQNEEIIAQTKKIKESECKFKTVADFTYAWEFWLTPENEFIYNSPSCKKITGYTPEEFKNNPDLFFHIIHKEDLPAFQEHGHFVRTGKISHEIDFRITTKDGEIRWINHMCQAVFNETGDYVGIRGSNRDYSRRKEIELLLKEKSDEIIAQNEEYEQLNEELIQTNDLLIAAKQEVEKTNEKLLQLNTDKDKFISILAHDLKNPFNSILGFLDLLTNNIREYDIDEIENQINIVNKSALNTYELLEDILMWVRANSGKIPFVPQNVNLSLLCSEIIENLQLNADIKGITINHLVKEEILVFADENMLKTILRNLVSNAMKYSNNGGHIDITAEKNQKTVTITVSDNGIGIAPGKISKVFDISETHTTRGTAHESGTGLGLLICKEFVEKHGQKIWAESEVRKGSNFRFTLDLIDD